MADELEALWQKLTFTEEEDESLMLGNSCTKAATERGKYCLVMRVLSRRCIILDALRKNLRMLWKPKRNVKVSEIEEDLFLVEFDDERDKRKVLDMCPWNYEKNLVLLQEFEGDKVPKDLVLKWSPLWVQIHNLPLKSRTRETGLVIGASLGEVLEVDVMKSGVQWSKYLRVRVKIDISRKLIRGKRISIEEGTARRVNFKYERLPNFCYCCGMLDHDLKDCLVRKENGIIPAIEDLQYGTWMRGEPIRKARGDSTNSRNKERSENIGSAEPNRGMRTAKEPHVSPGTSLVGVTSRSNLLGLGDHNIEHTTRELDKLESKSENYQGNGKIDLCEEIPESCMLVLGKGDADVVQCPINKGESMY